MNIKEVIRLANGRKIFKLEPESSEKKIRATSSGSGGAQTRMFGYEPTYRVRSRPSASRKRRMARLSGSR